MSDMNQPLIGQTVTGKLYAAPYIPERMAHKLTFTGAVEGEYDGSADTEVAIPTVPENVSAFANDAGYLTQHQDISGKLDASALPSAVNDALAQAKASGAFDGKSAYQHAQDGGYTGTEEEFAAKLAFDPFIESTGELVYTQTVTFDTDAGAAKFGKASFTPNTDAVYWLEINGEMYKCHWEKSSVQYDLYDTDGNHWMQRGTLATYLYGQVAGTYTYNLYAPSEELMIEPQYLPPNIALKSDIPDGVVKSVNGTAPDENGNVEVEAGGIDVTATVGQTIVVTEVDANGKPTKWEAADYQPRTHWSEVTEILPETAGVYSEDAGGFTIPFVELTDGAEYKMVYNGVEYVSGCMDARQDGVGEILFGNIPRMLGTGDNGCPFMGAMVIDGEAGMGGVVIPLDDAETVTLSITEIKYTPIHAMYLSNVRPYCTEVIVDVDPSGGEEFFSLDSVEKLENAYNLDRQIVIKALRQEVIEGNFTTTATFFGMLASVVASTYGKSFTFVVFAGYNLGVLTLVPQEDGTYIVDTTI